MICSEEKGLRLLEVLLAEEVDFEPAAEEMLGAFNILLLLMLEKSMD